MAGINLEALIENGELRDVHARRILLLHFLHTGTGTCALCGQPWVCDKAANAKATIEQWGVEGPRLRALAGPTVEVPR